MTNACVAAESLLSAVVRFTQAMTRQIICAASELVPLIYLGVDYLNVCSRQTWLSEIIYVVFI